MDNAEEVLLSKDGNAGEGSGPTYSCSSSSNQSEYETEGLQGSDDSLEVDRQGESHVHMPPAVDGVSGNIMTTKLPTRLFATDRFPNDGRVNSYSKMQYLIDIVDILGGTPEFDVILNSQFGKLFNLPTARCSLSGKLLHNLLCRQLLTQNKHDAWFTFGGKPLRFSIEEFERVTGLRCGPFPEKRNDGPISKGAKRRVNTYWKKLFGTDAILTIGDVVDVLRTDPSIPGWRRLRLALIVLVEGVLICGTQPVTPTTRVVAMVKDLEGFMEYPWGRESFLLTLRMVRVGSRVKTASSLVTKLKKTSVAQHGFPLAIQLWLFEVVPSLKIYLPRSDCVDTFVDRSILELPRLTTYHSENILKLELDPQLTVISRLVMNKKHYAIDVSQDPCVAYVEQLLDSGAIFTKSNWVGGDNSLSPLCLCTTTKNGRCNCGSNPDIQHRETQEHVPASDQPATPCPGCADLKQAVLRLEETQARMEAKLAKTLKTEVERMRFMLLEEVLNRRAAVSTPQQEYRLTRSCSGNDLISRKRKHISLSCSPRSTDIPRHPIPFEDVVEPATVVSSAELSKDTCTAIPGELATTHDYRVHGVNGTGNTYVEGLNNSLQVDDTDLVQLKKPKSSPRKEEKENCISISQGVNDAVSKDRMEGTKVRRTYLTRQRRRQEENVKGIGSRVDMPVQVAKGKGLQADYTLGETGLVFEPFPLTPPSVVQRLKELLKKYNKRLYDLDGIVVPRNFFTQILTPREWLSNCHLDVMIRSIWRRCGHELMAREITITDCYFTQTLVSNYKAFCKSRPEEFKWPSLLRSYVCGRVPDRVDICPWGRTIQKIYAPMNWGCRHWVGLVINLKTWEIIILDPLHTATPKWKVPTYIEPVASMLPYLLSAYSSPASVAQGQKGSFTYSRPSNVSSNERTGDCGPMVTKLIELHSHELPLDGITEDMVDQLRISYAVSVYSDFVKEVV